MDLDEIDFFESRLSRRAEFALRNFFYGESILSPSHGDTRQIFDACLQEYRARYGNGTPLFPSAVANLSEAELLRLHQLGRKSLREVKDALAAVKHRRTASIGWEWNLLEGAAA